MSYLYNSPYSQYSPYSAPRSRIYSGHARSASLGRPATQSYSEFHPVTKSRIEYVPETRIEHVPVTRTYTDYVEERHEIEHVPVPRQQRYTDYVPVDRYETVYDYEPRQRSYMTGNVTSSNVGYNSPYKYPNSNYYSPYRSNYYSPYSSPYSSRYGRWY